MLRVWWLSGQLAAFIPIEEMLDVRGLKQRLNQLHQLPPRFRQRVLFYGENLADAAMLTFPMDLTLASRWQSNGFWLHVFFETLNRSRIRVIMYPSAPSSVVRKVNKEPWFKIHWIHISSLRACQNLKGL